MVIGVAVGRSTFKNPQNLVTIINCCGARGNLGRDEGESRLNELETMIRERDAAMNGRDVSQDALARMAIRNTQMKVCFVVTDLFSSLFLFLFLWVSRI